MRKDLFQAPLYIYIRLHFIIATLVSITFKPNSDTTADVSHYIKMQITWLQHIIHRWLDVSVRTLFEAAPVYYFIYIKNLNLLEPLLKEEYAYNMRMVKNLDFNFRYVNGVLVRLENREKKHLFPLVLGAEYPKN